MQPINWNDLRYVLAIARGKTLSSAARLSGVDSTTVSRRLGALRHVLRDDIFHRQPDGRLVPPDLGAAVARAETIEQETDLIAEIAGQTHDQISGNVRITSVPFLINRLLAPRVSDLLSAHPNLQLELIPESRDLDLTLRETDIALRFARPVTGGNKVLTRRIGSISFAVFAARHVAVSEIDRLPWIGYDDTMAHLPQARWIEARLKRDGAQASGLRVRDVETAIVAVAAGVGRSLLPVLAAGLSPDLRRLDEWAISREVWLLLHQNHQSLRRIKAVTGWIEMLLRPPRSA